MSVNSGVCLNASSNPGLFLLIICRDFATAVKGRSIILEAEVAHLNFLYI